jgi:hypothetical protein
VRLAACFLVLAVSLTSAAHAQGFGSSKEKVTLHRKLPPTAHLNGSAIEVQVTGHNVQSDVVNSLRDMLEAELSRRTSGRTCIYRCHPERRRRDPRVAEVEGSLFF